MGVGITINGGPHSPQDTRALEAPGAWWWVVPSSNVGWGSTLGARKLISGKNRVKMSAQSELRISRNIRNGFRPDLGNEKHKRTEREILSWRGSRPSATIGDHGPEGELSSPSRGKAK